MVQNGLPFQGLHVFEVAARHLRFARAAAELGITPTAVSKVIGQLESQLEARLFHRTTRSVALTEAGERLLETVRPALVQLRAGVEQATAQGLEAAGTVRLNTSFVAWKTLVEPHLSAFARAHPRVVLDVSLDNLAGDIVAKGFDLGIRPGRGLQRDMVGIPLGGSQRLVVVGAPKYLAHAGTPKTVDDLLHHDCIRQRLGSERWLEWTLVARGKPVTPVVRGHLVVDEMRAALGAAVAGNGLAYVFESFAAAELARRELKRVLEDHALPREPFFLYCPNRKGLPPKLRVLIDFLKARNRP